MEKNSVTFIIPAYNCSQYIERCVESALNQESCDVEVIIVNDGSSDSTHNVIKSFSDDRVKYVNFTTNRGPSHARNIALSLATHDWISILDSDDWVEPDRCKILIEHALENNLTIIADDQKLVSGVTGELVGLRSDNIEELKGVDNIKLCSFDDIIANPDLGIIQPIFSRRLLDSVEKFYDVNLSYGEDYEFLVRLVRLECELGLVTKPMYNVSIRQGSLVSNKVNLYSGMIEVYSIVSKLDGVKDNSRLLGYLDAHIKESKKTIAYGKVVDNIKEKKYFAACKNFFEVSFLVQLPSRLKKICKKNISRYLSLAK